MAKMLAVSTATVGLFCVGLLLFHYVDARLQAPHNQKIVESLEEKVKTDAAAAVELTAEREKQTEESLERKLENQSIGTILMVMPASFLLSMNWLQSSQGTRFLPMEKVIQLRSSAEPDFHSGPGNKIAKTAPSPEPNLATIDKIVQQYGRKRDAAIPILREVQLHYGYLPDKAMERVCELTEITPAQIAGTSSFYSQFRTSPVGKHLVRVCHGTACHVSGITQISEELRRHLKLADEADTDAKRLFTLEKVACLGCCSLAPVMMIDDWTVGKLTPSTACQSLQRVEAEDSE